MTAEEYFKQNAVTELRVKMRNCYPHMCRDDHQQIGHSDSESERCPLCRANDQIAALREQIAEMEGELAATIKAAQDANGRVEPLLDQIASLEAERDQLEAAASTREDQIGKIMIGGNHLASALIGLLGAGFPSYPTPYQEARKFFTDIDHYDAWICWKIIMEARDTLLRTVVRTREAE